MISLLFLVGSCKKASVITTSSILDSAKDPSSAAGSLALSMAVVEDLELALTRDGGLNATEAAVVRAGALAGLESSGSLSLTNSSFYRLHNSVPAILQGAMGTMSNPQTGLTDASRKIQLTGVMNKAIFQSMKDKMTAVSEAHRESLPGNVVNAAISTLDEAGLTGSNIASAIGVVTKTTVSALSDVGYTATEFEPVITNISQQTITGMKNALTDISVIQSAVTEFVANAVGSLDETGIQPANMSGVVGNILTETVGGLDDLGMSGVSQMQNVVGAVVAGAVSAFDDAGVTQVSDIGTILTKTVQGTMDGIRNAAITTDKLSFIMDDVMNGAVTSFNQIGIQDAASIQNLSAVLVADAIDHMDNVGIQDLSLIKSTSEALATGTMTALGDLKDAGVIDRAAVEAASQVVSTKAVDAIYVQATSHGYQSDITNMASSFTDGMVAGLAEAGWNTTDISAINDDIGAGFRAALIDEATINPTLLETMVTSIDV